MPGELAGHAGYGCGGEWMAASTCLSFTYSTNEGPLSTANRFVLLLFLRYRSSSMSSRSACLLFAAALLGAPLTAGAQDTREAALEQIRSEKAAALSRYTPKKLEKWMLWVEDAKPFEKLAPHDGFYLQYRIQVEADRRRPRRRRRLAARSLQPQRAAGARRRHLDAQLSDAPGRLLAAVPRSGTGSRSEGTRSTGTIRRKISGASGRTR